MPNYEERAQLAVVKQAQAQADIAKAINRLAEAVEKATTPKSPAPGDEEYRNLIQATGDMLASMEGMHDAMKRITDTHRTLLRLIEQGDQSDSSEHGR